MNKNKALSLNSLIIVFCIVLLTIISGLAIYQADSTLGNEMIRSIIRAISYILTILSSFLLITTKGRKVTIFCFIPIGYWLYTTVNKYDGIQGSLNVLVIMILCLIFLLNSEEKYHVISYYRKYIILMSFLGIIAYTLFVSDVGLIYRIRPYYSSRFNAYYIDYYVSYIFQSGFQLRLCGLFNEPGYFGTILALLICVDKCDLRHTGNWIMFIAGILTFSVAFVIIILTYLVLTSIKQKKTKFAIIVLMILYFIALPNIKFSNPNVQMLMERIILTDNQLAGDNRSNIVINNIVSDLWSSPRMFFGYGGGYSSSVTDGVLSYKTYLIDYGIIGMAIIYGLPLIFSLKTSKNLLSLSFTIVFFASVYQRPHIYTAVYFVILICGIEMLNSGVGKNRVKSLEYK